MSPGSALKHVLICLAAGAAGAAGAPAVAASNASFGLPPMAPPPAAVSALGERLFFDRRLSRNGTMSCAMCHVPGQGFTGNELRTPVGLHGASGRRNAPTLFNVAHAAPLFHDGRAATLEEQALMPLTQADEMGNRSLEEVLQRLRALPDYRGPWRRAFADGRVDAPRLAQALSAFQRTLLAADSPFDRWRYGDEADALSDAARRGFEVFVGKGCAECHAAGAQSALFSDGRFHNTGVQARSDALAAAAPAIVPLEGTRVAVIAPSTMRTLGPAPPRDLGRLEVTSRAADLRAFRTPTLRNVALTAPYMHDGSMPTLEAVLEHYAGGGWDAEPLQDERVQRIALNAEERTQLLAFLHSLTSPHATSWLAKPPKGPHRLTPLSP